MENIPGPNQRLKDFIEFKTGGNVTKFGLKIGQSQQVISRLFRFDNRIDRYPVISPIIYRSIYDAFPDINPSWLEDGIGEMIKPKHNEAIQIPHSDNELEVIKREDGTEFRKLGDDSYLMITPLITEFAYGGYAAGWSDPEYVQELPRHAIVVDSLHFGIYRSFQVKGHSMDNGLKGAIGEGYIVTGRRIDQKHWKSKLHIHKYEDFVIVGEDGISVKRIIEHKVNEGIILCSSLNEDKNKYPNFELKLTHVKELYNIIAVTEKK